jgi:hypothetical protein
MIRRIREGDGMTGRACGVAGDPAKALGEAADAGDPSPKGDAVAFDAVVRIAPEFTAMLLHPAGDVFTGIRTEAGTGVSVTAAGDYRGKNKIQDE